MSADFLSLAAEGVIVKSPLSVPVSAISVNELSDGCFANGAFVCIQVFNVTIPADVECSEMAGNDVIDLSGRYQIAFDPECRELKDGAPGPQCVAFEDDLGDDSVVVEFDWEFVDRTCGVSVFDTDFAVNLTFYTNDSFASGAVADGDHSFEINRDHIYGEAVVSINSSDASELFDLVSVSIESVFVCTSSHPDLSSTLNSTTGLGGCLSSHIDDDSFHLVVGSGANAIYNGSIHDSPHPDAARFSFRTFDSSRSTINVHVQLLLTMNEDDGRRRQRRMLLQDVVGLNQIRHFIGSVGIAPSAEETASSSDSVSSLDSSAAMAFADGMAVVMMSIICTAMTMTM